MPAMHRSTANDPQIARDGVIVLLPTESIVNGIGHGIGPEWAAGVEDGRVQRGPREGAGSVVRKDSLDAPPPREGRGPGGSVRRAWVHG
jgi:hypothetical protein